MLYLLDFYLNLLDTISRTITFVIVSIRLHKNTSDKNIHILQHTKIYPAFLINKLVYVDVIKRWLSF